MVFCNYNLNLFYMCKFDQLLICIFFFIIIFLDLIAISRFSYIISKFALNLQNDFQIFFLVIFF